MQRKILVRTGLLLTAMCLVACNGQDVSPTDRPNENGDSGAVEEQMAEQEQGNIEAAQSRMDERKIDAEMRQQTPAPAQPQSAPPQSQATPAPAPAATPAAAPAPAPAPATIAAKPEAATEVKPEAKPEAKPAPKAEVKAPVTFLNSDDAPALSSKKTDSGMIIEDLRLGDGPEAKPGATVTINYHGTLKENGQMFDTTRAKQPATFPLNRLIKGWQEGVPGMKTGGIRRLTVPYQLAYGESGRPPVIPPKSDLVFIIELIQIAEPTK